MNRHITLKTLTLPAITLAGLLSASADATPTPETAPADSAKTLREVMVVEQAVKAPVTLLPLDVTVVDSKTIDNSAESNLLPVLQNRVPGMFVTERGLAGYGVSSGAGGSVSIRGVGGGNKVLFMIDGQPQWAGVFGHALPDTYVTNDVERVEVVSGPSSMLYGSGAMGGSVNLITRRAGREGFSGAVRAAGGSFATQKYNARAGYRHAGLRVMGAASYESTDGNRRGMGYWLANQYAAASYSFSRHWEAGVDAMVTETRADNPGEEGRELPLDMWTKMVRVTTSVFVRNRYEISSGGVQAYYNWGRHDIDDGLDRQNRPRTYLFHSRDYNTGVTLYQTVRPWEGNHLSAGVDFKHWGGRAFNTDKTDGTETPIVDRHVNEIAGYAMMQQTLWHDRLSLNAGVRLEHSSQFGNRWVPQAGFILRPLDATTVKFSYGQGFRSPTIRELYMYGPRNPELRPESMDNYEVSVRQRLLGQRLDIGLALYYINGDNLIQQVMVDGALKNMNTGRFINKGFELDATYAITPRWAVTANYAYLHTSTRITGAPRNKLYGEVAFTPGRWQFSVDLLGVWDLKTEQTTQSYALLNARAAYTVPLRTPVIIFVKGDNLTAARYEINHGFPMPRATVLAGLELRF